MFHFLAFFGHAEIDLLAELAKHGYTGKASCLELSVSEEALEGVFGGVFDDEFGYV